MKKLHTQKTSSFLILFLLALFAAGPLFGASPSIGYFDTIKKDPDPVAGKTYYMRHCIKYENDEHVTTNYWRGSLLPINTKVTLVSIGSDSMTLKIVETGGHVRIVNKKSYSKKSIREIAKNMLAPKAVPIEKFDKDVVAKILSGDVSRGMTKEQVIMSRGYPPGHKTSSLSDSRWHYWSSRFIRQGLIFEGDILAEGRDI